MSEFSDMGEHKYFDSDAFWHCFSYFIASVALSVNIQLRFTQPDYAHLVLSDRHLFTPLMMSVLIYCQHNFPLATLVMTALTQAYMISVERGSERGGGVVYSQYQYVGILFLKQGIMHDSSA